MAGVGLIPPPRLKWLIKINRIINDQRTYDSNCVKIMNKTYSTVRENWRVMFQST